MIYIVSERVFPLIVRFEIMEQDQSLYRVSTFGSLQINNTTTALPLTGEKPRSLLAYLILHPRLPHRREMLADLLWPDAPPDRGRRNLSDVLYRLQKAIPPEWLIAESDTLAFQPNASLWVDVWEFDRLISSQAAADLQKAVELYTGDLLAEIFDDWILAERELRRSQYLSALETLSVHHESQGNLQQALLHARRLILTEPLHEPAHHSYLRLLGRLKRYGEALSHYEYLRTLLRSELDSEPMAETRQIVQSLERERDLDSAPIYIEETRPFVGRKAERAIAIAAVESMLTGNGSILIVEGEAGIGKSRLLREIETGARWRGATVLHGQVTEHPGMSPFSPLVDALHPFLTSPHGRELESSLSNDVLAVLTPLHPAWGREGTFQNSSPEHASRHFYTALQLFGEALATLAPLVLVLDDLHWADPVLWQSLKTFAVGFANHGGLLILAYRLPDIEKLPGREIVRSWEQHGSLQVISLKPLTLEDVAELAGDAKVDPAEVLARTGGNPFFINEWLAEPDPKRPANRDLISIRLQSLSPAARAALESASILGENIPYPLWMELAALPSLALAGLSEELSTAQWLQASASGYTFVHDLIRAAVYEVIEPARRCALHQRAARAYQRLEPENVRSYAFHLDRGGLTVEAAAAYRRAGEQDLARFAYREAQAAFERALILSPPTLTPERMELMLSLASAFDILGERTRELVMLEEVLRGAQQLSSKPLELKALLALGLAVNQTYQYAQAEKHLLAAVSLARKLGDEAKQTEAYLLLGMNKTGLRQTREAIRYYKRALKLARKISSLPQEAAALRGLGIGAREMGAPTESIKWLKQALDLQHELGDRLGETVTQSNLVTAYYDLGAWDQLIAIAEKILPQVEAVGYRYNAGYLRHLQGLAFYNLGEYASARQRLLEAGRDFEAAGDKTSLFYGVLGLIAEEEGNTEEALRLYRQALTSLEEVEDKRETPILQLDLGALLWRLEQPREAIPYLEAARATWLEQDDRLCILKSEAFLGLARLIIGERIEAEELAQRGWSAFQSGMPAGEKPQSWLWTLYQLLIELEQPEYAEGVLQGAYQELQRQARTIGNPELRRSFFTKVPLNRAITSAHDQLTKTTRVITVSLAQREASLGRSLREDEYVRVQWTVSAPEDESITDKTAQRRYRLKRLLQEAQAQGAAPTDGELGSALGVSRRTILRDMQELTKENLRPPTRKRKGNVQSLGV